MNEPDLSGVDPLRVPEARRRIAAIRSYLTLPDPTTADAIRIGESIGLSRWRFVRLVAIWRAHRDARLLVMDRRNDSGPASSIDPLATAIADDVIREVGADAKLAVIAERIEARCADAGIKAPARPTIWRQLRKVQATTNAPAFGPPRIVIGRMWFHLPVDGQPTDAMPMALVAVMLPERLVVAHRVSVDPEAPPSVADLVAEVADRRTSGAEHRPLLIEVDDRRAAAGQLHISGLGGVRPYRRSLQMELSKAFDGKMGQIKTIYSRGLARPAMKKPGTRQSQPLTVAEAIDALETAIDASNAAAMAVVPPFGIVETQP